MIIGPVSASNANLIFSNSNLKYFCLLNDNEDGDGYYFWPSVISFRNIHINFLVGKKIGFNSNTQGNFNIENNKISKLLKIID